MSARRSVRDAMRNANPDAEAAAHQAVDDAKTALGERGPVWSKDGARTSTATGRKTPSMLTGTRGLNARLAEETELPKAAIFDLDGMLRFAEAILAR